MTAGVVSNISREIGPVDEWLASPFIPSPDARDTVVILVVVLVLALRYWKRLRGLRTRLGIAWRARPSEDIPLTACP
ncbi:hypothetical protein ACUN29_20250 [Streptomyces sp. WC2508]|uniref:hypothetical protein n=1 Tax=Streptomyces sp. WC2508 TaxID=3461405 RepID=UPI004043FC00